MHSACPERPPTSPYNPPLLLVASVCAAGSEEGPCDTLLFGEVLVADLREGDPARVIRGSGEGWTLLPATVPAAALKTEVMPGAGVTILQR